MVPEELGGVYLYRLDGDTPVRVATVTAPGNQSDPTPCPPTSRWFATAFTKQNVESAHSNIVVVPNKPTAPSTLRVTVTISVEVQQ